MSANSAARTDSPQSVRILSANPSALGLFGLAIVTLVASSQKLGWTSGVAAIVPWALFLGACAQLLAGIIDFKNDNGFGGTAFCAYGFFWLAVAMSWMTQLGILGAKAKETFDPSQLGMAFVGFLVFTLLMTLGSMGTNKLLFVIFVLIDFLFAGLALNVLGGVHLGHQVAGWSEFLIAIASFYGVGANVLNGHYKQTILPVGSAFGPWVATKSRGVAPMAIPMSAPADAE